MTTGNNVTAQEWFALGQRVPYDPQTKRILPPGDVTDLPGIVHVFQRIEWDNIQDGAREETAVLSFCL